MSVVIGVLVSTFVAAGVGNALGGKVRSLTTPTTLSGYSPVGGSLSGATKGEIEKSLRQQRGVKNVVQEIYGSGDQMVYLFGAASGRFRPVSQLFENEMRDLTAQLPGELGKREERSVNGIEMTCQALTDWGTRSSPTARDRGPSESKGADGLLRPPNPPSPQTLVSLCLHAVDGFVVEVAGLEVGLDSTAAATAEAALAV